MTTGTRCSIIVNTYNRAPFLHKLLAAFNHVDYDPFEIVVVNGPSTDGTAELLAHYAKQLKTVNCPETNLSLSRNLGIAAATGEIVVFIDDDAIPADPQWLSKLVAVFDQDVTGTVAAAGGPALHRDSPHYEFQGGLSSDYGIQIFRTHGKLQRVPDGRRWVRRTVGCNSAFRRSALVEIGGFDEHFSYYLDETDVCLRLVRHGYEIVYLEECAVRHYPVPSSLGDPFWRNRRIITRSDTYFSLKNGADPLFRRLLTTLWLAPRKHFVTEVWQQWKAGTVATKRFATFHLQWLAGLLQGLVIGLLGRRRLNLKAGSPPSFSPYNKNVPKRKLSICLLSKTLPPDPGVGGVARYTYELARGLHELGHEVHLICQSSQETRYDNLELTVHGIPEEVSGRKGSIFPNWPVLDKNSRYAMAVGKELVALSKNGVFVDVVHCSNWDLEGLSLPLLNRWPWIIVLVSPLAEVADIDGWQLNGDLQRCIELEKWQIEQADHLCCPSWGVLEAYKTRMRLPEEVLSRIRRVQLGILPDYRPTRKQQHQPKRMLFVGRLERRKGAHILLEVLPQFLERHPDWVCDLVGNDQIEDTDGATMRERFCQQHAQAAWLERVHFHGLVTDEALHSFYRQCDIFVAPSLFESFGLVYLEAMQYGKAVIGVQVAGIPEIISDGADGLLVPPGDPDGLLAAMERLAGNSHLRVALGQAAKAKVQTEFNHLAMARRMLVEYNQVLRAQRRDRVSE